MSDIVCTLFEGHYQLGAGALLNSLHAAGFTGRVVCGYRGEKPRWADEVPRLRRQLDVHLTPVDPDVHFTYYKPAFLRHCAERHGPDAGRIFYFDPDIVVKAPWPVIERWATAGLALCEDVNAYLPARHPYRLAWEDFLQARDLPVVRALDRYYNAGFVGVPRANLGFLDLWSRIIDAAAEHLGELSRIKFGQPNSLFHTPDQDALNMALMVSPIPVNGAGPEGMDFQPGGHLLSHAIGGAKPWRGGFLPAALRGQPPGAPQKAFFHFADSPLRLFSSGRLARLRFSLHTAALLGRLYRRRA